MPVSHNGIVQTSICGQQSVPVDLDKSSRKREKISNHWKFEDRIMPAGSLNSSPYGVDRDVHSVFIYTA